MKDPLSTQDATIVVATHVGVIGGGQLGLMTAEAAHALGFAGVTVLDPTPQAPASAVAQQIIGSLKDPAALRQLAEQANILTYEIEHIDVAALHALEAEGTHLQPAPALLAVIQNKYEQKEFLSSHGIPVAPYMSIATSADIERAAERWGYPLVLKAKKDAYDGRGNARVNSAADVPAALAKLGDRELYVEQCLPLQKELGLMLARNARGESVAYPVVEMIHERDICQEVLAPAAVSSVLQEEAREMAHKAIDALRGIGIFGIELFLDTAGKLWLNEIAPRPHNLGHYTIEACETSQFEQLLRAVCNLSLGSAQMRYPAAVMINILGTRNGPAEPQLPAEYDHEHVFIHLYGKRETRIDRKMGHITVVGEDLNVVYQQAKAIRAALSI